LPVLVTTVHVFVFIVFASLDGGRVTTLLPGSARHSCTYSICLCQLRIHLIRDGRDVGEQQAEIQSIQHPEARSCEAFPVVHQPAPQASSLEVVAFAMGLE
jgi:hypothetical protein